MKWTQVALIGACPSGQVLGAPLHRHGIHHITFEQRRDAQIADRGGRELRRAGVAAQVALHPSRPGGDADAIATRGHARPAA